jgi:hypothetical protein
LGRLVGGPHVLARERHAFSIRREHRGCEESTLDNFHALLGLAENEIAKPIIVLELRASAEWAPDRHDRRLSGRVDRVKDGYRSAVNRNAERGVDGLLKSLNGLLLAGGQIEVDEFLPGWCVLRHGSPLVKAVDQGIRVCIDRGGPHRVPLP